jgi:anti-anti-sigma factor
MSETSAAAWRVIAEGEIDLVSVPELQAALERAERSTATAVVLDLSSVTFIDSSGIRVLVECARRDPSGGRFSIIGGPAVDRVVDMTGLRDRLPLR